MAGANIGCFFPANVSWPSTYHPDPTTLVRSRSFTFIHVHPRAVQSIPVTTVCCQALSFPLGLSSPSMVLQSGQGLTQRGAGLPIDVVGSLLEALHPSIQHFVHRSKMAIVASLLVLARPCYMPILPP
nr:hypothetical protein [Candidatus Sigynarchaeota archaeon]